MAETAPLDLDLRLVRYFTVVAEQRHFGRASTELRVAQPSLSRQISRLEQQLGVRLLDRTPQGTTLTEAGEVFLPKAKTLLRSADQAAAHARAAAQPSHLTVGYSMGIIVTPAVLQMRQKHPDADIRATHLKWDEARSRCLITGWTRWWHAYLSPPTSCTSRSCTTNRASCCCHPITLWLNMTR